MGGGALSAVLDLFSCFFLFFFMFCVLISTCTFSAFPKTERRRAPHVLGFCVFIVRTLDVYHRRVYSCIDCMIEDGGRYRIRSLLILPASYSAGGVMDTVCVG